MPELLPPMSTHYEGKVTIRVTHLLARSEAEAKKRIADIVTRQGFFVDEVHAFEPMEPEPTSKRGNHYNCRCIPDETGAETPPEPSSQPELPNVSK